MATHVPSWIIVLWDSVSVLQRWRVTWPAWRDSTWRTPFVFACWITWRITLLRGSWLSMLQWRQVLRWDCQNQPLLLLPWLFQQPPYHMPLLHHQELLQTTFHPLPISQLQSPCLASTWHSKHHPSSHSHQLQPYLCLELLPQDSSPLPNRALPTRLPWLLSRLPSRLNKTRQNNYNLLQMWRLRLRPPSARGLMPLLATNLKRTDLRTKWQNLLRIWHSRHGALSRVTDWNTLRSKRSNKFVQDQCSRTRGTLEKMTEN